MLWINSHFQFFAAKLSICHMSLTNSDTLTIFMRRNKREQDSPNPFSIVPNSTDSYSTTFTTVKLNSTDTHLRD